MYVALACRIMTCSISKGFATYHGSMECEINYNYNYNNPHTSGTIWVQCSAGDLHTILFNNCEFC